MTELNKDSELFNQDNVEYNQRIKPVETPNRDIGIDVDNQFMDNIVGAGLAGKLDMAAIESFTNVSRSRDSIYNLLDMMMADSTMASVLETYAEDSTEYNDQGRIVWVEADNPTISKYIEYLLDTMGIDKHIYSWVHCLVKYGDVYVKLYRKSDEEAAEPDFHNNDEKSILNEGVIAKAHNGADHYTGYVEMVKNPAEVFELTKLGKTRGYIKTNIETLSANPNGYSAQNALNTYYQIYRFNGRDVELYAADDFVHGFLEDNSSRVDEKVNIFYENNYNTDGDSTDSTSYNFNVRRGQSLFYTAFKAWRELSLVQNAILMNRITKSALIRAIMVNVGDMPKEMVGPHMQGIKQLIEQKSAITAATSISEYTNPGPIENNIYIPVHGETGTVNIQAIGGEVDIGNLTDLDKMQNQLFGSLRVPKQYFGLTDDAAGFNGGSSLAILSSRYAKAIKRIQNAIIQMVTDLINLQLIDRGFDSYVNDFTIRMQAPTTQEEIDRRENEASKVNMVRDIMDLTDRIEDPIKKLEILKSLLSNVITDTDVIQIIQDEIDALSEQNTGNEEEQGGEEDVTFGGGESPEENDIFGGIGGGEEGGMPEETAELPSPGEVGVGAEEGFNDEDREGKEILVETDDENNLPSPAELGIDMVY